MSVKQSINSRLRIVEPVFNVANARAEYRLPADTLFFSDLRLVDVGSSVANNTLYNALLGAESVIRAIRIFDGSTELDAVNDFGQWRAVQKLQVSNDGAGDMGSVLSRNQLGFLASGYANVAENFFGQTPQVGSMGTDLITNFGRVGQKAWVSLKSIFPFLNAMPMLPTSMFRQLRVEVEYNSAAEMQQLIVDATFAGVSSARALLLADEINDPMAQKAIMEQFGQAPITWMGVVEDSFLLQATGAVADVAGQRTAAQEQTQRLRGFDSTYLHDLILKLVPLATPTSAPNVNKPFGALGSKSQFRPEVQIAVNGQNLIPREGLHGKMRALAHATDSLGSMDLPVISAKTSQKNLGNGWRTALQNTAGEYMPYATDVEMPVEDLQVTIRRSGVYNNPDTTAQYRVYAYGRISKALVFEAGAGGIGGDSRYKIVNVGGAQ